MNKTKQQRNKLPLLLASLLTISLVVYGSFAYFTSGSTENADLKLSLGHIEMTSEADNWVYESVKGDANTKLKVSGETLENIENGTELTLSKSEMTDVSNARPGDTFTRQFTFKNTGTLDASVSFTHNFTGEGPFKVTVEKNSTEPIALGPDESFDVTLTVKVLDYDEYKDTRDNPLDIESYNKNYNIESAYSLDEKVTDWAEMAINVQAVQENYAGKLDSSK